MEISVPGDEIVILGNIANFPRNINNLTGITDKVPCYVKVVSLEIYSHHMVFGLLGFRRHEALKVCSFHRTWR